MSVFLLNVGDAFFTMLWLERGGQEANPVMAFFLDIGPGAFLVQKCLIVGFWLLILVVHKNFRFARVGLYVTLVVYGILMLVHFSIILFDIEPPPPDDLADAEALLENVVIEFSVSPEDLEAEGPTWPVTDSPPDAQQQLIARRAARSTSE
jgi:hypothetical protein